jgi:hypothetical protein
MQKMIQAAQIQRLMSFNDDFAVPCQFDPRRRCPDKTKSFL